MAYKLDTTGKETMLYSFGGFSAGDGDDPRGNLAVDAVGNLYGTTFTGGSSNGCGVGGGCGVVFKLDTSNNETILYDFTGGTDGAYPISGLIQDSAGNLYGFTRGGGDVSCGCGVIYKLTAAN